jgi:hypothetical protein
MACCTTSYWRARLGWHWELQCAQKFGLADSGSFPPAAYENRSSLVDTWREAVVKQLLTPAPNVAAVAWKRAKLSGGGLLAISPSKLTGSNARSPTTSRSSTRIRHVNQTGEGSHEAPAPIASKSATASGLPLTPDGSSDNDEDAGLWSRGSSHNE